MASTITGLHIYPVKGCKGVPVQRARICPTGLAFDRHWVIIQDDNDKFETQRKLPKMALIKTQLPAAAIEDPSNATGDLTLSVPGKADFKVGLQLDESRARKQCKVWEWEGIGIDEGDGVAEYLSEFMGHPVRLVRYAGNESDGTPESASTRRQLDRDFAPDNSETAFSDAMPFMIANEASLEELNTRLEDKVPMNRFRPNITVNAQQAWEEDSWAQLKLGDIPFQVNMPNGRCKVTTINQTTAEVSKKTEPLRTLGKYRSGKALGWEADRSWRGLAFFGWYMLARGQGIVSVGDRLEVLETREGPPTKLAAVAA